jgi:hypothetical protein
MPSGDKVIINRGALECIEKLTAGVDPTAFIRVKDSGPIRAQDVSTHVGVRRLGGSVPLGLIFPYWKVRWLTADSRVPCQRAINRGEVIPGSSPVRSDRARVKSCARDSVWTPTGSSMPRRKERADTSRPDGETRPSTPTAE